MPAEQIHLVRHGEVFNPQGVLYGRLPGYGLSDLGRLMAKAAADDSTVSSMALANGQSPSDPITLQARQGRTTNCRVALWRSKPAGSVPKPMAKLLENCSLRARTTVALARRAVN